MLWICNSCTAAYSPDAPRCPQCGSTDHREQGEEMAKITVHGGPSNLAAEEDSASDVVKAGSVGPAITGGGWGNPPDEDPVPVELSPTGQADGPEESEALDEDEPAAAAAAETTPVEDAEEPVDYETFTVGQLRELLSDRALPVSGTKSELVARLAEDDAARLNDVEVSGG